MRTSARPFPLTSFMRRTSELAYERTAKSKFIDTERQGRSCTWVDRLIQLSSGGSSGGGPEASCRTLTWFSRTKSAHLCNRLVTTTLGVDWWRPGTAVTRSAEGRDAPKA